MIEIVSHAILCDLISMAVVRRLRPFTALSFCVLLALPVFMLNLWVMHKGALAKVLAEESLVWMGVVAVWALASLRWLLKARWTGLWSVGLLAASLFGVNVHHLVSTRNYALAFYALFLLIISGIYCLHLYRNLREAYYSSGKRWFEGRPPLLPRIEAELRNGEHAMPVRLSRLGLEGCFAFAASPDPGFDADRADTIALKLDELRLECAVELISKSKDGSGRGLRFRAGSADQQKDISDFLDRVRSSGYVS